MKLRAPRGSLYTKVAAVRLYLDDLEYLSRLIEDAGLTVKWSDDQYEYDSLDEVREKRGARPPKLTLEGTRQPSTSEELSIEVTRSAVTLYAFNPDNIGDLQYRLPRFLEGKRSLLGRIMFYPAWTVLALVWLFLYASGWQVDRGGVDVSIPVLVLLVAFAVVGVGVRQFQQGISLSRRHHAGFFRRNADNIWLLVIGAIIGGVLGSIITYTLTSLLPN